MNRPDIKLLVSYAGRKEGNYGYIYQATSWEYLGYFLSEGFWLLDGEERHQITVWFKYKHHGNQSIPFTQGICELYSDVRQTTTKQFIYIKRLDKKLHCASPVLPYPKPSTDFPICTNVKVHKANADGRSIDELIAAASKKAHENQIEPHYLYEDDSRRLFGGRVLHSVKPSIAIYNENGDLEGTADTLNEACDLTGLSIMSISNATRSLKISGGYYFRHFQPYTEIPADQIETDYICIVDGIRFTKQVDLANFCGVTKQAVSIAKKRHSNTIGGYEVVWREDKKDCPEN